MVQGKLIFFCGKMGAGKSTKAQAIACDRQAILISEDEWLSALYPDQIKTVADYVKYSGLLKPQIRKLTQSVLQKGIDVVLDFPANTVQQRHWLKSLSEDVAAPHALYVVEVPDDVCLARIEQRALEQPDRGKTDTPEMFYAMLKYYQSPTQDEGLNILQG